MTQTTEITSVHVGSRIWATPHFSPTSKPNTTEEYCDSNVGARSDHQTDSSEQSERTTESTVGVRQRKWHWRHCIEFIGSIMWLCCQCRTGETVGLYKAEGNLHKGCVLWNVCEFQSAITITEVQRLRGHLRRNVWQRSLIIHCRSS
jgi:hypothetical protein